MLNIKNSLILIVGLMVGLSFTTAEAKKIKTTRHSIGNTKVLGVGAILGDPIGANVKYWLKGTPFGAQALVGYDISDEGFSLSSDALYHWKDLFTFDLPWMGGSATAYSGMGGKLVFEQEDTIVRLRFPVGMSNLYRGKEYYVFTELVPTVEISPDSGLGADFGLGLRYYF